ncbi:hypothetical protein F0U62_16030 [Cystobacter fuscus]|uniref:LysR family substrate-binding domain-containing protein n=1 Tax=Cystobacter fuscus TaxID=43 RepID=UPI002B2A997F|nr:hypothetical protein F0U62_16030 [Cystobacter fuscus]
MRQFQRRHPGVQLSLGDHSSPWQLEVLTRGELDAGFLRPPVRMPAHLESLVVRREPMRLAVPSAHPLAKQGTASWRELAGEPLILVEPGVAAADYYSAFFERCRQAEVEPVVRQYTGNVATQVWLVSAGLGVAPLPNVPDLDNHPGVTFVGLPRDAPVGEIALVWRRSDTSPALLRFIAVAEASFGPPRIDPGT